MAYFTIFLINKDFLRQQGLLNEDGKNSRSYIYHERMVNHSGDWFHEQR
jgi:hypothetical protein